MPAEYTTTRRVEFADTDLAGIVHFSVFFRYMESVEVEFLRSRGLSVKLTWEGMPIGFPRVSASCEYQKPATFEDELTVKLRLEGVGRKSLTYSFEFTRNGDPIAQGRTVCVCCRVLEDRSLESIELPESLRERLATSPPV